MNKFEQLIEYVINDEQAKAEELFHEIVVAKSRQIYESIMAEEAEEEELDESAEEELDESEEEDLDESFGGDSSDDLISDVEADEEADLSMEAEEEGEEEAEFDIGGDEGDSDDFDGGSEEPATKDDILNLEDKLDQLMSEFEDLMGGEGNGDGFDAGEGGDAIEMDDTEEMDDEMFEAVSLKAAPKPVTSEEGSVNKKSSVAANAGAKGPIGNSVKPVHTGGELGGKHDSSAYSNTTKELIGKVGNTPAQGTQKPSAAPKPTLSQASGVNTKSPVAKG